MEHLEQQFREAVAQQKLPGVLVAFASKDEKINYLKTFGNCSLQPSAPPLSSESVLCLASCTKLVTSVAAMQCIENGLVTLDSDITTYLPEWKEAKILIGFKEGEEGSVPILKRADNSITLAQLLTHTSGITGLENEEIEKYYAAMGSSKGTLFQRYFMSDDQELQQAALPEIRELMGKLIVEPLVFEPGTGWAYGQSIDWAGQLIERLTHKTLEEYCQEKIFQPLGMTHTTYRLLQHPEVAEKLIQMTTRAKDGSLKETETIYPVDPAMDLGGSNLYTSVLDFMRLLQSLLRNDGKLLRPETANLMLGYRLKDPEVLEKGYWDEMKDGMKIDHCLAGLVNVKDVQDGCRAGTVSWQGATKCYWWIDVVGGICGFYGSQLIGVADKGISAGMYEKFMKSVYASLEN